jgi:ectoine hydroxylase-related dioxygenase (phytanoyl-CoA dioxygenase family)
VYFLFFKPDSIEYETKKYNLKEHGFCVLPNVLSREKISYLKDLCEQGNYKETKSFLLQDSALHHLIFNQTQDSNYQFQDYIWIIQKSSVHTCHRDNNGDFFNEKQKYPSYTMLIYLENMEKCLGVIPQSHLNKNAYNVNFTDQVKNLVCKQGDIILFNANLII